MSLDALNPKSFLCEVDESTGVARVTLNRPDRLNALTFEVYEELRETFLALDRAPGVRSVLLTGAGRAFCSGGDVEDIIGRLFEKDYQGLLDFTRVTGDLILSILRCRRPVIAALNGTVAGAGAVIASACDIRIASEKAKIAFLFTKVGLSGARYGRLVALTPPGRYGAGHGASDDRRLHRRGRGPSHRSLQPGRPPG